MDSRFTDKSRSALRYAHEAAREANYNFVGSEHIIAGILKEGSSKASAALESVGVTYEEFVTKMIELSPPDSTTTVLGAALPLTPRCKTVLEMSFNEAKKAIFVCKDSEQTDGWGFHHHMGSA